ncbi:cell wall hydrolase [Azospirillum sp.]|uniref:cell wall hydrolase n=1 Tax=Azospirillum sp. TaxID=34012 RepID=UPI0026159576|nr:cell wall hydrolase [Azospirillum sp.]
MIDPGTLPPREIIARTLWGEARGEGIAGMAAVAGVIANRVRSPRWWGKTVSTVCLKPYQFSCWLKGDPNRDKLLTVTEADRSYWLALEIADELEDGRLRDVTAGADHYHSTRVQPEWSRGKTPVATIGVHRFYRLELSAPAAN